MGELEDCLVRLNLLHLYDIVLILLSRTSSLNLPDTLIEELFSIAPVLTGSRCLMSFQQYRLIWNEMSGQDNFTEEFKCGICGLVKLEDAGCQNCNSVTKRGVTSQNVCLSSFDTAEQLSKLLIRNGPSILLDRTVYHAGQNVHDDDDIRSRAVYTNCLESAQEFQQNVIHVPYIIHADGTTFDKKSTCVDWPMTMGLLSLPKENRFSAKNLIMLGNWSGYKKPTPSQLNELFQKQRVKLARLKVVGLDVLVFNVMWTFRFFPVASLCDYEAHAILYDMRLGGEYSCPSCLLQGSHMNGAVRFTTDPQLLWQQRSEASDLLSSALGLEGFRSFTSFHDFIPQSHLLHDALHLCEEGLFKDILSDILGKTTGRARGRRAGLRLDARTLAEADTIASTTKYLTYSLGRFRQFSESTGKIPANERQVALFFQLLAVFTNSPCHCELSEAIVLILLLNHRRLLDRETPTMTIDHVACTIDRLAVVFNDVFTDAWSTLKCHIYFCHFPQQLREFGNLRDTDARGFENLMGQLKREGTSHATNGYLTKAFQRLNVINLSASEIEEYGPVAVNPVVTELFERLHSERGARGGESLSDHATVPLYSDIQPTPLEPLGWALHQQGAVRLIKRVLWRKQSISVEGYQRCQKTRQDHIAAVVNGILHLGKVGAIGVDNAGALVFHMQCYVHQFAYLALRQRLQTANHPSLVEIRNLFDEIVENNMYIRQLDCNAPMHNVIISENDIVGLGVLITWQQTTLFVISPLRFSYA